MPKPGGGHSSGISLGDVLRLPKRHPAWRRREAQSGSCTERENLAGDAKGKSTSGSNREAESTDAPERGGLEGAGVMLVERRGQVIAVELRPTGSYREEPEGSAEGGSLRCISGAKGRNGRPQFDALCRDATKRQFDMLTAWSVDRLGRSLQDLVAFLSELHALGIDLFLHQQGIDTTTPSGKAMFQMMGVFAEFERSMIQERVRAGLARARSEGKRLGRPPIAAKVESAIRGALAAPGRPGVRKIAKQFGVNPGTVQRISRPFDADASAAVVVSL